MYNSNVPNSDLFYQHTAEEVYKIFEKYIAAIVKLPLPLVFISLHEKLRDVLKLAKEISSRRQHPLRTFLELQKLYDSLKGLTKEVFNYCQENEQGRNSQSLINLEKGIEQEFLHGNVSELPVLCYLNANLPMTRSEWGILGSALFDFSHGEQSLFSNIMLEEFSKNFVLSSGFCKRAILQFNIPAPPLPQRTKVPSVFDNTQASILASLDRVFVASQSKGQEIKNLSIAYAAAKKLQEKTGLQFHIESEKGDEDCITFILMSEVTADPLRKIYDNYNGFTLCASAVVDKEHNPRGMGNSQSEKSHLVIPAAALPAIADDDMKHLANLQRSMSDPEAIKTFGQLKSKIALEEQLSAAGKAGKILYTLIEKALTKDDYYIFDKCEFPSSPKDPSMHFLSLKITAHNAESLPKIITKVKSAIFEKYQVGLCAQYPESKEITDCGFGLTTWHTFKIAIQFNVLPLIVKSDIEGLKTLEQKWVQQQKQQVIDIKCQIHNKRLTEYQYVEEPVKTQNWKFAADLWEYGYSKKSACYALANDDFQINFLESDEILVLNKQVKDTDGNFTVATVEESMKAFNDLIEKYNSKYCTEEQNMASSMGMKF